MARDGLFSFGLHADTGALERILAQQEPYPGVIVDRRWNLLQANNGAIALVEFLLGPAPPGAALNLAEALVGPDALRPHLVNWSDVVRYFVRGVESDAAADASEETAALLARLVAYEGVRAALSSIEPPDGPVLPMYFRKGDVSLRLFTIIATLGTPQDITLQELRIESFFPMDDRTHDFFRRAAAPARVQSE